MYDRQYFVPLVKQVDIPAAATAAVVTIAAPGAGLRTILKAIFWSYSAAPTGGRLTITDGGVTVLSIDVTAAGPGPLLPEMPGGDNSALVITLASGAGAVEGRLTCWSHPTDTTPGALRS